MRLYTYFRSSAAFRVRIALNLKGLPYEPEVVSLPKDAHRQDKFAQVNRQQLVPVLVTDDGLHLAQSLAIIEYLEETHPHPPLLPPDARGRARVRSLSLLVACEIHPLNNLRTLRYLKRAVGQDDEQINTWYRHWMAEGLSKLEAELQVQPSRYCHGDAPSMADCCLVPQIFNAQRYQCDLSPYPTVMGVFDECMALEAFQRAQPSRQPDAE